MRRTTYYEAICCVCGKKFMTGANNTQTCSTECRNIKRRKASIDEENHQQRLAESKRKHPNRPKTLSASEQDLWDIALEASKYHTSYGKLVARSRY